MIGVTGASGRLGQAILKLESRAIPIGRRLPSQNIPIIIHAATIRDRTESAAIEFASFNNALAEYTQKNNSLVVNIGSCWQILNGTCQDQPYTHLKNAQERLFPEARHLVAYWIYGPERGFINDLKVHLAGGRRLLHAGSQLRDFIHVEDVAKAALRAVELESGRYSAASGTCINPHSLTRECGIDLPIKEDPITAELAYPLKNIAEAKQSITEFLKATS